MFSSSYENNVKIEICDFWLGKKKLIQSLSSQELDISKMLFSHFASSYASFLLYEELLAWGYKKNLVVSPVLLLEIKGSRATANNPTEVQEDKEICWNIALHLLWPPAPVQSWVLNISQLCPLWKSFKRNCRKCRIKHQHLQFKNLLVKWIRMYISTGSEPWLANGSTQLLAWIQQCISI